MRAPLVAAAAMLAAWGAAACPGLDAPCEDAGGTYHLLTPEGPPRGVVLFLHGWGGTGLAIASDAGLTAPVLARGYAFLAPQGTPRREGDTGGSWNSREDAEKRDDVAFLPALLDAAAARFGLPRDRVLAAGFSDGGMMTWRLACDAPAAAAAYAPVAGLFWRPLPETCSAPVRLLHTHGWADPVVPIEGRSVAGGRITQGDLFVGLDLLRRANRCEADAPDAYDAVGPFLRRFWSCPGAGGLGLALHPGGHWAPPEWADMALDWFEAAD